VVKESASRSRKLSSIFLSSHIKRPL